MSTRESPFLTAKDAAALLHLNEKSIYQLAQDGVIPGTKVTGKWLFPRRLLEHWVVENCHSGVLTDRLLIGGCADPLLQSLCTDLTCSQHGNTLFSYHPSNSKTGLALLDQGRIDVCCFHWGTAEPRAIRQIGLLRGYRRYRQWVVLPLSERQHVLATQKNASRTAPLRIAARTAASAQQRLWQEKLDKDHIGTDTLTVNDELQALQAVLNDRADACLSTQAAAQQMGLDYQPIAYEGLYCALPRGVYFRHLFQQLLLSWQQRLSQAPIGYRPLNHTAPITLSNLV